MSERGKITLLIIWWIMFVILTLYVVQVLRPERCTLFINHLDGTSECMEYSK